MKTATRAAANPETLSFETTVENVEKSSVWLDETYFYPEGGGQPADRGTIAGVRVVDVQQHDDGIEHVLAESPSVSAGDRVTGVIDDDARTYAMRAHTASHVVYGAARRLLDSLGYGGFDIADDHVRIDLATSRSASEIDPSRLEQLANTAVWESRSVEWYTMTESEAHDADEVVFNQRTANATETKAADDDAETVRIVEIDGWDVAACGGTHVASTIEIGPIAVASLSNPGAGLVRVEFSVGPDAIERHHQRGTTLSRVASRLDTGVDGVVDRAEMLVKQVERLEDDLDALRREALCGRFETLAADTFERDGDRWIVGTVPTTARTVADEIGSLTDAADVVVLVGRDGTTFVVVATEGEPPADAVLSTVLDGFDGGGGGSPTLAQGGGISAPPEAVVSTLREQ